MVVSCLPARPDTLYEIETQLFRKLTKVGKGEKQGDRVKLQPSQQKEDRLRGGRKLLGSTISRKTIKSAARFIDWHSPRCKNHESCDANDKLRMEYLGLFNWPDCSSRLGSFLSRFARVFFFQVRWVSALPCSYCSGRWWLPFTASSACNLVAPRKIHLPGVPRRVLVANFELIKDRI